MRKFIYFCTEGFCLFRSFAAESGSKKKWISLFDGKSLNKWKANNNAGTFVLYG